MATEARAKRRGTVTSLSSMLPAEEARKASQRVQETISEKHKELGALDDFITDNTNLINLVQRVPDELHHRIMVPFGKAAFFPGRLVHTNEFMILLGEGYYAERTAKQTVDILKRRGKTLESQVDSLKAVIEDLKTEASFFDRTAAEAAEGLVEIREEYADEDSVEEDSISGVQKSDAPSTSEEDSGARAVDDEEYARILSRFDELEREELEAGDTENLEDDRNVEGEEDSDDENGDADEAEDDENVDTEESEVDEDGDTGELENEEHDESSDNLIILPKDHAKVQPHPKELSELRNLSSLSRNRGESSRGKTLMQMEASKPYEEDHVLPSILKTGVQSSPTSKKVSFQIPEPGGDSRIVATVTEKMKTPVQNPKSRKPDAGSRPSRPNSDSLKAFSGTIVERIDNLSLNPEKQAASQLSNSQSSRPVSRFKMQRRAQGLG